MFLLRDICSVSNVLWQFFSCIVPDSRLRASSPAKNLIIKSMPDVTVVFVNPASMPKVEGSEAKDMSYDLTLDSRSDSVSFTASVLTASPTVIDMVQITYGDSCVSLPVEKIFIERKEVLGKADSGFIFQKIYLIISFIASIRPHSLRERMLPRRCSGTKPTNGCRFDKLSGLPMK